MMPLALHIVVLPPLVVEVVSLRGFLRTIGELPSFAQRHFESSHVKTARQRHVEAVAQPPIRRPPVVICSVLVISYLLFVVVVEQGVSRRKFQSFHNLIASVNTETPSVGRFRIVAGSELAFHADAPLLPEVLLRTYRCPHTEIVVLRPHLCRCKDKQCEQRHDHPYAHQ